MTSIPPEPDALDELVFACLERYPVEGTGALDLLCAEHPDRADDLRRRMARLLATGLVEDEAEETFPERLGEFRLLRRLGGGGMGVVYLAVQESLGREVALKLIRPDQMFFPGARERFRREVELVARLGHAGVVPIYTFGEENGIPFFAMERVDGCTLAEVLADVAARCTGAGAEKRASDLTGADFEAAVRARSRGGADREQEPAGAALFRGSWAEVCLAIGRAVALALEHAHRHGVLHRDVKPSNVLVTPDGRVLLFDFGLSSGDGVSAITRTGSQLGSLPFMAPEQFEPGGGSFEPRTDVYQLGATLTELLTLRRPFAGLGASEAIQAIRRGALPAVSPAATGAPTDARVVIAKATAATVADRYASAADLARDLGHVLARRPIEAQPPGPAVRLRRAVQRRPERALSVVLVGLLLAAGSTALAVQQSVANRRTNEALDAARREGLRAEENLDTALAAVVSMLAEVGDETLQDVPGMSAERLVLLERASALFGELMRQRPGDVELELRHARILSDTADVLGELGQHSRAEATFADAETVLRRLHAPGTRDLGRDLGLLLANRVDTLRALRRPDDELAAAREAYDLLGGAAAGDDASEGELIASKSAACTLAWTLRRGERLDESVEAFDLAVGTARRLVALEPRSPRALAHLGDALCEGALVRFELGDVDASERDAEEGLARMREAVDLDPAWTLGRVFLLQALSQHCVRLGEAMRFEEAAALGDEGAALADALVRDFPARSDLRTLRLNLLANHGFTLVLLGRREDALPLMRAVAQERERQQRREPDSHEGHLLLAQSLNNLATLAQELERYDEACDAADRAVEMLQELHAASPEARDVASQLGFARIVRGEAHAGRFEYPDLDEMERETRRLCPGDPAATCMLGILAARCYDAALRDPAHRDEERAERAAAYLARTLESLEEALQQGFDAFWMLEEAVELESIRELPAYRELLARYRE